MSRHADAQERYMDAVKTAFGADIRAAGVVGTTEQINRATKAIVRRYDARVLVAAMDLDNEFCGQCGKRGPYNPDTDCCAECDATLAREGRS